MLFSSDALAQFINSTFEPVWESVREVPMVTIDFGSGHQIKRTLHGNIATYICQANGEVLDIIPGIYTPDVYRDRLDQALLLVRYVKQRTNAGEANPIKAYHSQQLAALKEKGEAQRLIAERSDMTKAKIERPLKLVATNKPVAPSTDKSEAIPAELARWKALAEDTQINETERRLIIHQKLASESIRSPELIKKWLYKEVLHADLDDPYLGLGEVLFKNYPFADEDRRK